MNNMRHNQQGLALLICLILLTVSTLIGITSVNSTILEEKMSGNIRNKHLSFQATESAMRDAENFIITSIGDASLFDGTVAGQYGFSEPADSNYPIWEASSVTWRNAGSVSGTNAAPQFLIEPHSDIEDLDACSGGEIILGKAKKCIVKIYRVTAKGTGLNSNSETMIQSSFAK